MANPLPFHHMPLQGVEEYPPEATNFPFDVSVIVNDVEETATVAPHGNTATKLPRAVVGRRPRKQGGKNMKLSRAGRKKKASTATKRGSNKKTTQRYTFPLKVYDMVDNAERECYDHIISWTGDGKGLIVKDVNRFESHVLPKFFGHNRIRSFTRQLSYWSFTRVTNDSQSSKEVIFQHPGFVRGERCLLSTIARQKSKGFALKRSGVCINLRHSSTKEVQDAVSALQEAELNYMEEIVKKNALGPPSKTTTATHDTKQAETTNEVEPTQKADATPAHPTTITAPPRRVSYELSNEEVAMFTSSERQQCDSNNHHVGTTVMPATVSPPPTFRGTMEHAQEVHGRVMSPVPDILMATEIHDGTDRRTDDGDINSEDSNDVFLSPFSQEVTGGAVPFEGRFFHDVGCFPQQNSFETPSQGDITDTIPLGVDDEYFGCADAHPVTPTNCSANDQHRTNFIPIFPDRLPYLEDSTLFESSMLSRPCSPYPAIDGVPATITQEGDQIASPNNSAVRGHDAMINISEMYDERVFLERFVETVDGVAAV